LADTRKKFLELRKKYIISRFSKRLNPEQVKAATTMRGPLLILAGAGSGKTTVIVNRIMCLLEFGDACESEELPREPGENDVSLLEKALKDGTQYPEETADLMTYSRAMPWSILAITFTNKAAGELKDRIRAGIEQSFEGMNPGDVAASTFHSMCVRILRRYADLIGYPKNFSIYDDDDSVRLMKEIYKTEGVDDRMFPVKGELGRISRLKDRLIGPESALDSAESESDRFTAMLYGKYQKRLRKAGAMDFDDLICETVELLRTRPEVKEHYHKRFRYIMVDEYQDTSHAQDVLCRLLTNEDRNICVVGDDDQSIYRFRGATVENILNFDKVYPGTRIIRLERNYRSTGAILAAANAVISNNKGRKGKELWTDRPNVPLVGVYCAEDEDDEARYVSNSILKHRSEGAELRDCVVLYRVKAQSNAIENYMRRAGVPYRIVGGTRFYDRAEVKDIIAYMEIVSDPADDLRLRRIINTPARKIGPAAVDAVAEIAGGLGISMLDVIRDADSYPSLGRSAGALKKFASLYDGLCSFRDDLPALAEHIISDTGYRMMLESKGEEGLSKLENAEELISNVKKYCEDTPDPTLEGFLEDVALISDIDEYDPDADACTMMTLHSAKGLEFDYVYMVGMEEGIFPGQRSMYDSAAIEEERRLAYVGITRAKKEVTLTRAETRLLYGSTMRNKPSRFLLEIPDSLKDDRTPARDSGFERPSARKTGMPSSGRTWPVRDKPYTIGIKPRGNSGARYSPGDSVEHKVFGRGVVLDAVPMGGDTLLTVRFEKSGVKKMMGNYAPLTRLEMK
jgi:DNA helicase-2/ATP-dependent DNA helicase PcrA